MLTCASFLSSVIWPLDRLRTPERSGPALRFWFTPSDNDLMVGCILAMFLLEEIVSFLNARAQLSRIRHVLVGENIRKSKLVGAKHQIHQ